MSETLPLQVEAVALPPGVLGPMRENRVALSTPHPCPPEGYSLQNRPRRLAFELLF